MRAANNSTRVASSSGFSANFYLLISYLIVSRLLLRTSSASIQNRLSVCEKQLLENNSLFE